MVVSLVESLLFDIVEDKGEGLCLLSVVLDSNRGGSLDFPWLTVFVILAVTEPSADVVSVLDLDQGNVAALSEGLPKIVRWVICGDLQ